MKKDNKFTDLQLYFIATAAGVGVIVLIIIVAGIFKHFLL
jgi:hypothetical protein